MEVLALVASIVSAFAGTATFLAGRKKRGKAERKSDKARRRFEGLKKLQRTVVAAPREIRREYDVNVARIGPMFASGDCESSRFMMNQIELLY
jgi:hypothetical protein